MRTTSRWICFTALLAAPGIASLHAQQYEYPFQNPNLPLEQRADNIVSLMTLDEKIAALGSPAVPRLHIPAYGTSEGIHQVVLRGGRAMANIFAAGQAPGGPGGAGAPGRGAAPAAGGPPAAGAPGGAGPGAGGPPAAGAAGRGAGPGAAGPPAAGIPTTSFAQVYGMGETWDPALIRRAGGVEGYEARFATQSAKYNRNTLMLMGPTSDLARDPRWGRNDESYGEDPFLTGTMAAAFAKGIQGDNPKYWQAASLLKHLFANSNETTRGGSSSDFDERLMREYYSVPFRMAFMEGGAKSFMTAYNAWNGIPMVVNPVLRDVVAKEWGAGWTISPDAGAMGHVVDQHHYVKTALEANIAALKVGVGNLGGGMGRGGGPTTAEMMKQALGEKLITEADIDAAIKGKYKTIIKLGLLDPPDMVPYTNIGLVSEPDPWYSEKHKGVARQVAHESVVLLKNANGMLPLKKAALKTIAVVGPRAEKVSGDFYGAMDLPYAISVLQGIKDKAGSAIKVKFAANNDNNAAVDAAKASDIAVVVVGNDPFCGGSGPGGFNGDASTVPCPDPGDGKEGRDRETIELSQEALVKAVYAVNPKTVVVLVSSFPYAINWSQANVPAILHITHSAQEQGSAIADVLFGDYNPGGHLVQTWPKSLDQLPPMMDYNIRHGRTYMYFKGEPLYPFGYGLSYSTFKYANMQVSAPKLAGKGTVTVSVDVTNTSQRAGDEVVQLYVKHGGSKVERPNQELKGFERVTLKANETKTVKIPLKAESLAYWNTDQKRWVVEPERIKLVVGGSSADAKLTGDLTVGN